MLRWVLAVLAVPALALAVSALAGAAWADSITLEFERVTDNADEDVSDQFSVVITDNGDGDVLFVVHNEGGSGVASSICDIYWGPAGVSETLLDDTVVMDSDTTSVGVSFSNGARPENAPGGTWDAGAAADSDSPVGPNGIRLNETGGFLLSMLDGVDWSDIQTSLLNGELRMAFHVQAIGSGGDSDTYESVTPVPEPATLSLLGLGLAALAVRHRRKTRV